MLKAHILIAAVATFAFAGPAQAQGLMFDKDHDVLVLPDCEVAVRYNNKTFMPVKASKLPSESLHFLAQPVLSSIRIAEDFTGASIGNTPETIILECYDPGKIGPLGTNRFSKDFLKDNKVREVSYASEFTAKQTGVPISIIQKLNSVRCFEVLPKGGGEAYTVFALQHDRFLTMVARRMRSGRSDIKSDPPVIITEINLGPTAESKANIALDKPADATVSK